MTARGCNKLATLRKNLTFLGVLALSTACFLPLGASKSDARIIDSLTEEVGNAGRETAKAKGGTACNKLENVTAIMGNTVHPIRAGRQAFLHRVERCGERSELSVRRTAIGGTYWYGWSMYLPSNWQNASEGYDIVNQWATYPTNKAFGKACGAVGSYAVITRNTLSFRLQHKGNSAEVECNKYDLGNISEMRGKWVDFVMQAKWTGNNDGFLKFWVKIGNGSYTQKVDYKGPTFWNDEDYGPYFKMGLYKGDPNFDGPAPRQFYTDEYRLGDDSSNFEEVSP